LKTARRRGFETVILDLKHATPALGTNGMIGGPATDAPPIR
jgi:hypothetical protein